MQDGIDSAYESYSQTVTSTNITNGELLEEQKVELIERIKEIESSSFDINQHWDDTKIYNIFSNADKEDDIYIETVAMMISRWDKYNTSYKSYFRDVLDSCDETLVKRVSDIIECYTDYGDILENNTNG